MITLNKTDRYNKYHYNAMIIYNITTLTKYIDNDDLLYYNSHKTHNYNDHIEHYSLLVTTSKITIMIYYYITKRIITMIM